MAQPEALEKQLPLRRWAVLGGMDNRLARSVAGAPVTVRAKLLLAFLVISALLVLVGVLGLRFLAQANARVERLGTLQVRSSQYQSLAAYTTDLRGMLAVRAAGEPGVLGLTGGQRLPGGKKWDLVNDAINYDLSQVELATSQPTFGFVPPAADERVLERIGLDYRRVAHAFAGFKQLDSAGVTGYKATPFVTAAIVADQDLYTRTTALAERTSAQTTVLIDANRSAYTSSREIGRAHV